MAGPVKQVAIRLKPEGGAEVVGEARKVEEALVNAQNRSKAATEAAIAAADRQVQKLREVAAQAGQTAQSTAVQDRINRLTGVTGGTNARADVAARSLFAADDRDARIAAAIRAEIDPLWAAQDRYNSELAETLRQRARGKLTDEEAIRNQNRLQLELDQTTAALGRQNGGLTRNQAASRLNLLRQGADVLVTGAMGMNPGMIAIQQGPQILDAWATSGIKARASMIALGGALGIAAGAAAVAGAAWLAAERNMNRLENAATGLGRTAGVTAAELETLAIAGARQGEISIRSARDQAAAWVSTGKISEDAISGMLAISKDWAAFTGQDAKAASESLGRAMMEPDKAARDMTASFGLLDQATLKHIDSLVEQGNRTAAQKILLDALSDAVDGHADKVGKIESAWDAVAMAASNAFDWIGRALYVTQEERIQGLDDAIRREQGKIFGGSDNLIRRMTAERNLLAQELAEDRAEAAGTSARASANQAAEERRRREAARPKGRTDRSADRLARERLQRERRAEDRESELDMAWARAVGDTDQVRQLQDEVALRQRIRELVDADVSAAEARSQAQAEQNRLLAARRLEQDRDQDAVSRAASLEVDRILGLERNIVLEERRADLVERIASYTDKGRGYYASWLAASHDQLAVEEAREEVMRRQIALAEREQQLNLARLRGDEAEVRRLDIDGRIEARAREIERREKLNYGSGDDRARRQIRDELDAEAEGQARNWVKSTARDIRRGGIRDALADQFDSAADRLQDRIIDMIFSANWGALFGGAKGGGGSGPLAQLASVFFGGIGKNARGTDFWPGGWSWVGEEGPELVRMPTGSAVKSTPASMAMLRQSLNGGGRGPGVMKVEVTTRLDMPSGYIPDRQLMMLLRETADAGAQEGAARAIAAVPDAQMRMQINTGG